MSKTEKIGIVGLGAIGQMLHKELSSAEGITEVVLVGRKHQRDSFQDEGLMFFDDTQLQAALATEPDVLVVATGNANLEELLTEIAYKLPVDGQPPTVVLPQNSVGSGNVATQAFSNIDHQVPLVRGAIYTTAMIDDEGLHYNQDKLRIAIASIEQQGIFANEHLFQIKELFEAGNFAVEVCDDYEQMVWTKLFVNTVGTTGIITGLGPKDTFNDPQIAQIEARGLKDRLVVLEASGYRLPTFEAFDNKSSKLQNLLQIPTPMFAWPLLRNLVAMGVSGSRGNIPSAGMRIVQEGEKTIDASDNYHNAFLNLAHDKGFYLPIDQAMYEMIEQHNQDTKWLKSLSLTQRKNFLIDTVQHRIKHPIHKDGS